MQGAAEGARLSLIFDPMLLLFVIFFIINICSVCFSLVKMVEYPDRHFEFHTP